MIWIILLGGIIIVEVAAWIFIKSRIRAIDPNLKLMGVSRTQKGGQNGPPLNPRPKVMRPAPPKTNKILGGD